MLFPHHSDDSYRTVQYAFPLVIISALFAGVAAIISGNVSYVTISTDVTSVQRDQQFFIDVSVTAHVPINAVDLTITYPVDTVSVLGIDTGSSVITLWAENPVAENGTIHLRGGTFRKGFIGEHHIARIKAEARETGEARILLKDTDLVAGDGKGTPVETDNSNGQGIIIVSVAGSDETTISGTASISIITDTDGDGDVDLTDISVFMLAWFTHEKLYDFNGDGRMSFIDFSILLAESFLK